MIWLSIHKDSKIPYEMTKNEILVTVGTWDKLTTARSSTLQVWHMANYQVPTEGACSLTPVNTVYVNAQYTLALSWITA